MNEVLDDPGLAIPDSQTPFVSKSAAAQARQRVGPEPLKWLLERSAKHWVAQDRRAYLFKGLRMFALDGTTLRTHDTTDNRDHFGGQSYANDTVASYPQVRGVTLTSLPRSWGIAPCSARIRPTRCCTRNSFSPTSPMNH